MKEIIEEGERLILCDKKNGDSCNRLCYTCDWRSCLIDMYNDVIKESSALFKFGKNLYPGLR